MARMATPLMLGLALHPKHTRTNKYRLTPHPSVEEYEVRLETTGAAFFFAGGEDEYLVRVRLEHTN